MYALFAGMFTIRNKVTLIRVLNRGQNLTTCPTIGNALFVGRQKKISRKKSKQPALTLSYFTKID